MISFLQSLLLSFCLCAVVLLPLSSSSNTTCTFTVVFPNTTYPQLGELLTGTLSWNDTLFPMVGYPAYGNGYQVLFITGTRTLWSATAAANKTYHFNSSSTILNGVAVANYNFINPTNPIGPPLQFGGALFPPNLTFVGGLPGINGTAVEFFWDQLIYPSFPNKLDQSGLLLNLSTPQIGTITVAGLGNLYTLYAYDDDPTITADLTDDATVVDYFGPPFDPAGYGGSMTLTNCVGPAGRALGDPQLIGFLSQSFQVHGLDGQVYNLISTADMQVNAWFVFLSAGRCPVREGGRIATNCWSHPGSYFGQLSVQTQQGDRLLIIAGAGDEGFHRVELNERSITAKTFISPGNRHLQIEFSSHYILTIRTVLLTIEVENSDGFLNLLSVIPSSLGALARAHAHGLLGQTWRQPTIRGSEVPEIDGAVDDYAIVNNDMMGSDFLYNRFRAGPSSRGEQGPQS